ncbi:MAG: S8 family serine peptidase [Promethearchaeota archaeon]
MAIPFSDSPSKENLINADQDKLKTNGKITQSQKQNSNWNGIDISKFVKYDNDLKKFIGTKLNKVYLPEQKVKVIFFFKNDVMPSERLSILQKSMKDYKVLNNYDLIPGTYVECKLNELLENGWLFNNIQDIKKIYLSKKYQFQLADIDFPEASSLNKNYYPNWWIPEINADNLPYNGSGVRVGVIDTGIYNHPDLNLILNQSFVSGEDSAFDYDDYGHGTHVAGIIGGSGASSGGTYRGVAPGVSLISARAGNYSGLEEGDIISALEWLIKPEPQGAQVDIVSMSFGGGLPDVDDPLNLAMENVSKSYNVSLVASAGNSGPGYFTGGSPGSGSTIISVGAIDKYEQLASFSSWGPSLTALSYVDVLAPGVDIISTNSPGSVLSDSAKYKGDYFDFSGDGDYIPLSGTSMACPMVSGALAILKQAYPKLTPQAARIALLNGAKKIGGVDHDYIKYGAGIINVKSSLDFINQTKLTYHDINDVAKIFPEKLPIAPFDLLNFPGDRQVFNLTIISGKKQIYNITIPTNVPGLSLSLDKSQLNFTRDGVKFVALDVEILPRAKPGHYQFSLNISSGTRLYDTVNISFDVKLPEYKILFDSFHGLNDWFPDMTFYQIDFYDAMKDIANLNISMDYHGEYWTPYYNKDTDNSILTEELLSQYDLIILQTPVLPYSPLEIKNLKTYFDNGGNILFLGTRHQDLCIENINYLFKKLGVGTQVNEETLINENWLGLGANYYSQAVTNFNSSEIFDSVDKFSWGYGNTFSVSGGASAIAFLQNKIVASTYDGRLIGKGRFVAFGDLHWLAGSYTKEGYYNDHLTLLENLMKYFLMKDQITINIELNAERVSSSSLNISIYVKDRLNNKPIASSVLEKRLNISISRTGFYDNLTVESPFNGAAFNNSYSLPGTSTEPYTITVNLTLNSKLYTKSIKVLYYDKLSIPKITSFNISAPIYRNGDKLDIVAVLNDIDYDIKAFMAIFSYSYYNSKNTVNKTFTLNNTSFTYSKSYTPSTSDPAGYVITYIIPNNTLLGWFNPNSPRIYSKIKNHDPIIDETKSYFTVGLSEKVFFEDTYEDDKNYVYSVPQGTAIFFNITARDSVSYEDDNASNMIISVNLFIASVTYDGYLMIIYPSRFALAKLNYNAVTDVHVGNLVIPYTISYSTIRGTKYISTATNYDFNTDDGYLGLLIITVFDSEGGSENFYIIFYIEPTSPIDFFMIFIIIGVIALVAISIVVVLSVKRSRRSKRVVATSPYQYYQPTQKPTIQEGGVVQEGVQGGFKFCPYCGFPLTYPSKFCPNCGEQLM